MRKVFALFAGLILLSMLAACSEDSTPTPPTPHPTALSITTAAVPVGYTCSPYNQTIAASGGKAPYTWTIAETSDPLPQGLVLTSQGKLSGVVLSPGDFSFTVRCTDSSPTPKWVEKTYTMNVDVPSNPSMAIYYDNGATVCSSSTSAFQELECYVFIMLDGADVQCSQACEFKLRLTDANNVDLDPGDNGQFVYIAESYPSFVALTMGDLFSGLAISFRRPMYGPEPIQVASFKLLLQEDISNLSFKFDANPNGSLGIASCAEGYPMVPVTGRVSALNY
jgi:hypothetical protein